MSKEDSKLGFVLASKYRKMVLLALEEGAKTPKQLCNELSLIFEQISRTLRELLKAGIVNCLNPEARKGKLYVLSPMGKKIISKIKK